MSNEKRIGSVIILLLVISVIPHFTHMTLGRLCGCGHYNELSQYKNSEHYRIYRESGIDRIQSDIPAWNLMTRSQKSKKQEYRRSLLTTYNR